LIFQGAVEQRNFRGRGQTIGLNLAYSNYSKQVDLSFTEPYVFDKNVSLGVNVYRRDLNSFNYFNNDRNTIYQQATTGFQIRAGVPLSEYVSAIGSYTFNYDDISVDRSQYFSDRQNPPLLECDPIQAGRYLCDALGKRTSSILGLTLVYDTLDNRYRPSRGRSFSVTTEFAGLGGSVKYVRFRGNAAQFFSLGKGFIFSLKAEGGAIAPWGGGTAAGTEAVRLTDRFYLGEPQLRGFDIRGIGPRMLRKPLIDIDPSTTVTTPGPDPDRTRWSDDALGGRYYYLGHAELEIPLGSGAREMGLRPSIFMDIGAVWGIKPPVEQVTPFPNGLFVATRDPTGAALYQQINVATLVGTVCTPGTAAGSVTTVTNSVNPTPPSCLASANNIALGSYTGAFQEFFVGNSPKPRISIGIGVNWNSPFGPFRIDFAHALTTVDGDDTKSFTFNVGTQF
ncbi:MAG: BamA/TamA family outer membrane protein, partial [Novosphingobium sp.]|nr:BamA/TamA family outer membrane protein [Novosphingobium sp.]